MRAIEPIAIIGIGCRMPGGVRSPDDMWKLLVDGVDAISEVPEERWLLSTMYHPDPTKPGRMYVRAAGFLDSIDRFDAQFFGISPREAAAADPQQRLALELAYEAVEDAGLTMSALAGKKAGVYVGLTNFDYSALQDTRPILDAYSALGLAQCIAANRISYFFNLVGPSLALDTACSSSLVAVDLACRSLWDGESELAFAGGLNLMLRPETTIAAAKASMLSPDCRCKAFDSRANGFARGEGGGIVILKRASQALADGDRIYALVRGTAVNQDGRTEGITVPNRVSQEANTRAALELAGIAPESIQYVEAHGTGTPVGDPIEAAALGAVYGKARQPGSPCVIGSVKTNLGHLEAGAGITGLIKAALCLKHGQIPKNLHFQQPNPNIPFDDLRLRVPQQLEPWPETSGQPARAAVNSFGFGGTNAHAILEAAPAENAVAMPAANDDGCAWMLPLSARSASTLPDLARTYLNALRDERGLGSAALRDICHAASVKRSHFEHRLTLVAHDKGELGDVLEAFLRGEEIANSATGRPTGEPVRPVFVCSGMGQQWWAMGRQLLTSDPVYRRAVEEVNDLYTPLAGWSLIDKLTADEDRSEVQRTHVAQPAIFATQVGLNAMWRAWGIEPAAVFGHSAGEVVASYIAGALSLKDAVTLVYHRSTLLRRMVGQGSMLAVGIPRAEAERLVALNPQDISIAAINAERSITLSGNAEILAGIDKTLNEAGVFSRALQVEAPFHSPKVEQIEADLVANLRGIRPMQATIPFYSTVTGTAVSGLEVDGSHWYRNTRDPVLFADVMELAIKAGHRLFLEIGAHPVLRYDIAACLKENATSGTSLCSIRRGDRERAAMLGSLGRMHTLGADLDWRKIFRGGATATKLPPYPFQAEKHWRETEPTRRLRLGVSIHPLLGDRCEAPQPSWQAAIDTAGLSYLPDHRVGGAIVFPAAGYIEMGLAAAREVLGPGPCVVEDVEFQKILLVDETATSAVQVVLDAQTREYSVHTRVDPAQDVWTLHARGRIRQGGQAPAAIDLAQIRARCPVPLDHQTYYRELADLALNYGPSFQGIARLWRGDGEALVEIHAPSGVREQAADYRLHPAVLDACFHSAMAALPERSGSGGKHDVYLPAKVERIRLHAPPPERLFAHVRLRALDPAEIIADFRVMDEAGAVLVEVEGLICWPAGSRTQGLQGSLYEYQWKYAPRPAPARVRDSRHVSSPAAIASIMQDAGEAVRKRLDRTRYQDRYLSLSRSVAAAYMVRALRELGWDPQRCAGMSIEALAEQLGVTPDYHAWLRVVLQQLRADDIASTEDPHRLWKTLWDEFPDIHGEVMLERVCGEKLPAILRGELDPLSLLFPDGALTTLEHLYQDSPTWRAGNLLVQKAVGELVRRRPKGSALRILEIGGGTGGMTSFVLPVLPEHCTEYVFTDVSPRFLASASQRFSQYPFVEVRTLDIDRDPLEQGFEPHSFDLIVASDVLHATPYLRTTVDHVRQLLGSSGTLLLLETTRPWLFATLTFGLLKGWWLFKDHDLRPDEPYLTQDQWKGLLQDKGFSDVLCVADCPDPDIAPHSVILARGLQVTATQVAAPPAADESKSWLLFVDEGTPDRRSAGAALARRLRDRGDDVIEVMPGKGFTQAGSTFSIRAGDPDDMRRLADGVHRITPHLGGIVHLWSLDTRAAESMTTDALKEAARLGCVGVLHLLQAVAATDGLTVDTVWLVTRATQSTDDRADPIEVMQSPLWGLGRVAMNEYQTLHCRLVDLATCAAEEIAALADEMTAPEEAEDEIALHGALRYVRRLVPVTPTTLHRLGRSTAPADQPFRMELQRPGILESMEARPLIRRPPGPNEIEVEIVATGLNFKDLMLAMGMLPKDAVGVETDGGRLLGVECGGRVVAVGDQVTEFAVGDEIVTGGARFLATHMTIDARYAARKPRHLSLEDVATLPIAFLTALPCLHTLGQLQPGERVLIHSGTGGVGLAVVQMALQAGAIVFATAGSPEKRDLLKALGVHHVMDSRSLAFVDDVRALTGGEGVDLVVNSLAGEGLDQSLSLVRQFGRFVDISLRDIHQNRKIGMRPLRHCLSVFAFNLATLFTGRPDLVRSMLMNDLAGRFERQELRALAHRVFPVQRLVDAFRHMAQAKHIGKLVISMKDAEGLSIQRPPQPIALDPGGCYLITGGLGGFGLTMADHLARSGARRLALIGRSSPSPAARAKVDSLRQRGVEVMICQGDIADRKQAEYLLAEVRRTLGPLRGIMHAAMVLDDSAMELMTEDKMWTAMAPKIMGAWNLHTLTADAPLDFFVLCSSITSVLGNPGQANYAAGCAFLDTLAYYRRERGLPALAVNFGMMGEVGTLAANPEATEKLRRAGLKALGMSETLDALDDLLANDAVQVMMAHIDWKTFGRVWSQRIPARVSALVGETGAQEGVATAGARVRDILEADADALLPLLESHIRDHLARAMGASPARLDTQQSLLSLGLDSLMAVEMRNRINEELGLNVPLEKFMQGASIHTVACYIAERLLEGGGGARAGTSKVQTVPEAGADGPLSQEDAADLLERIDELSDAEIDQHLNVLSARG